MTGVPCYLVDTNVLVRYLANDHEKHSPAARRLMESLKAGKLHLEIPLIAIVETIHTLRKHYRHEPEIIVTEMLKILNSPWIRLTAPAWIMDALDDFKARRASFGDACVAAEARVSGRTIASFDQGFDGMDGVRRYEPK